MGNDTENEKSNNLNDEPSTSDINKPKLTYIEEPIDDDEVPYIPKTKPLKEKENSTKQKSEVPTSNGSIKSGIPSTNASNNGLPTANAANKGVISSDEMQSNFEQMFGENFSTGANSKLMDDIMAQMGPGAFPMVRGEPIQLEVKVKDGARDKLTDNLLSDNLIYDRDHLYNPIKHVTTKYPGWLRDNSASLSAEDRKKYTEQFRILVCICMQYEKTENDDEVDKEKVKKLVNELNDLGDLPTEVLPADDTQEGYNKHDDFEKTLDSMFKNMMAGGDVPAEGNGDPNDLQNMQPMMQPILNQLLSKKMMYQPMKQLTKNFPEWLRENLPTMDQDGKDKFSSQFRLLTNICLEYENTEGDDIPQEGIMKISKLLEELNELGETPEEISPNVNNIPFQNIGASMSNEQCNIM